MYRLPRKLNLSSEKTEQGKDRVRMRRFNRSEIEFLINADNTKLYGSNQLYIIRNNFKFKFGWNPSSYSLNSFYNKKTYEWVWNHKFEEIPDDIQKRSYHYTSMYSDKVKELATKFPKYNEFIKEWSIANPDVKISRSFFSKIRKELGISRYRRTRDEMNSPDEINMLKSSSTEEVPPAAKESIIVEGRFLEGMKTLTKMFLDFLDTVESK